MLLGINVLRIDFEITPLHPHAEKTVSLVQKKKPALQTCRLTSLENSHPPNKLRQVSFFVTWNSLAKTQNFLRNSLQSYWQNTTLTRLTARECGGRWVQGGGGGHPLTYQSKEITL